MLLQRTLGKPVELVGAKLDTETGEKGKKYWWVEEWTSPLTACL